MGKSTENPDNAKIQSVWNVVVEHVKTLSPLTPELIRAAYTEHKRAESAELVEQYDECLELREEWVEAAEIVRPTLNDDLSGRIQGSMNKHAENSPPPLTHRFPFIARIPGIRRWFR